MDHEGGAVPVEQSSLRTLRPAEMMATGDTLVAVSRQAVTSVAISVEFVGGTVIAFAYDTPNGNRPDKNDNYVHVWPVSANSVPFGSKTDACAKILGNKPCGDQSLQTEITIGAYVVGYAVGPKAPDNTWSPFVNVVASAYIPPAGIRSDPDGSRTSSIETRFIGQNTLVFRYTFLAGFDPKAANAWVGLWKGEASPYDSRPRWFAPITLTTSTGDAALDGLQLADGTSYTLALFASGFSMHAKELQLERLASTVVFDGGT
ncbi:MAG: hypothetical protein Tsb0019_42030 [Roseibium sp.]